jgi:hypothetical protein
MLFVCTSSCIAFGTQLAILPCCMVTHVCLCVFVQRRLPDALNELLPEAFATVREASRRVLGMRHFDSQLVGELQLLG